MNSTQSQTSTLPLQQNLPKPISPNLYPFTPFQFLHYAPSSKVFGCRKCHQLQSRQLTNSKKKTHKNKTCLKVSGTSQSEAKWQLCRSCYIHVFIYSGIYSGIYVWLRRISNQGNSWSWKPQMPCCAAAAARNKHSVATNCNIRSEHLNGHGKGAGGRIAGRNVAVNSAVNSLEHVFYSAWRLMHLNAVSKVFASCKLSLSWPHGQVARVKGCRWREGGVAGDLLVGRVKSLALPKPKSNNENRRQAAPVNDGICVQQET